ncbi:competence/damage inducible protein CinA [Sulfitobacter noctilucicola]|uniref:Nicotinamide-nucleotide amidase n=1 Tax=Sulfitobacter noctilucicola TaxID=1342301 RepID=A0A7W6M7D5_9RHOB|nr:CinA family protein [Sulfitobacter noctilucicola]KIN65150.1 competence/damage inducible protein CinA [Sulfitobacter noctilucicola]MBB4173716.1 nicotinamide-nucleotide amidase [Sulfitobacter noctilucicola]
MPIAADILTTAIAKKATIATAESCTGGMVAAALTDLPGSSVMMERGFVTYTNLAKVEMLGVGQATLDAVGAVSEEVAREMVEGALRNSAASVAVSITGIAGPGGSEHKPEGRVCFGVSSGGRTKVETREFGAIGRDAVRKAARDHALALILAEIQKLP